MPYDFTGCLAHIDLTYRFESRQIIRVTGLLEHNSKCQSIYMQRLPPIPLHDHVWQVALQQLNDGARYFNKANTAKKYLYYTSIAAIQKRNDELCQAKFYTGQKHMDPTKANLRYQFLPHDTHRLYKKYAQLHGVHTRVPPEYNIDLWLNPDSAQYKHELSEAIFYYQARSDQSKRFQVCIQTGDMKRAAWKYSHQQQLILDGTFGICDHRLLLFIALGVDEDRKGVPLAFFLFSAPQANMATQSGYDKNPYRAFNDVGHVYGQTRK
jgi:hypothetical protein